MCHDTDSHPPAPDAGRLAERGAHSSFDHAFAAWTDACADSRQRVVAFTDRLSAR